MEWYVIHPKRDMLSAAVCFAGAKKSGKAGCVIYLLDETHRKMIKNASTVKMRKDVNTQFDVVNS